jgi:hypothetical protein
LRKRGLLIFACAAYLAAIIPHSIYRGLQNIQTVAVSFGRM